MQIIKTSSRGQIVIPEEIRKKHKIKEGTKLVLFEEDGKLILEKENNFEATIKELKLQRKKSLLNRIDPETLNLMMASEKSLAKDWLSKEDEEAWKDL